MGDKLDVQMKSLAPVKDFFLNFLIPLICVGASALLIIFVAYPSFKSLSPLQDEIKQKQSLKDQLQTKLATLNSLVDYKSVVDENASLIQRTLVDEPMVPQLLTQIHTIATEAGLTVDKLNYSFTDPTKKTGQVSVDDKGTSEVAIGFKEVNVSLGASGNYEQLMTFLGSLEKSSRLVTAKSFRFSSMEKEGEGKYTITFSLASPYLKVESDAVTDDPINLNMGDRQFVSLVNWIKDLRYYDISLEDVNTVLVENAESAEESTETAENSGTVNEASTLELPGGDAPVTDTQPTTLPTESQSPFE